MKFGRVESLEGIDCSLPPDPEGNGHVLGGREDGAARIRLGLPRWADRDLVGALYPHGTPARRFLAAYAEQLETIELNATYYRTDAATLARWAAETPGSFRFCPKLPKTITHGRKLVDVEGDVARFVAAIDALGARLGTCWALLPEAFGPGQRSLLERFLRSWPAGVPLAVELRHPEWFSTDAFRSICDDFAARGVSTVITDVAGRRDVLHGRLTTRTAIVRFVGTGDEATDRARLDDWVERLARWSDQGLEEAYLWLHQSEERRNVPLAARTAERLDAAGLRVRRLQPVALV